MLDDSTPIRESELYYQIDAFPLHYCFYCGGRVCEQYTGLKVWIETFLIKKQIKRMNTIAELIKLFGEPRICGSTLPQNDITGTPEGDAIKIKIIISKDGFKSDRLITLYDWLSSFKYVYLSVSAYAASGKIETFNVIPRYVKLVKLSCPKVPGVSGSVLLSYNNDKKSE